ncbi:MAG: lipocalin-like domain-containing protein [Prevotella sp.]|nr:lipocalin-like domain-containing protein [Prevotella sp.]
MIKYTNILLAITGIIALVSCEIHSSDNGNLDNWWYLRQVENINGNDNLNPNLNPNVEDYVDKKVFWGFIGKLMQTQGGGAGTYLYRFEQSGGKLRVYEPHKNNSKSSETSEEGEKTSVKIDPLVEAKDLYKLEVHGLHMKEKKDADGNPVYDSDGNVIYEETFTIEQLTSERMVLLNEDKTQRLYFLAW